ncbi:MAG: hypothetical protein RMJ44_00745 [Cytophagales bacterium]|nr:hypothetical protein [Bernardetiaceae bacterium]MDW8209587.1 hypothetical protein [Cytophagales bacterium]
MDSQFNSFLERIKESLTRMTTLDIKTIVGDFKIDSQENVQFASNNYLVMESRINMLLGDITVRISEELTTARYDWVRQFHKEKEAHGYQIVQNNIATLLSLVNMYWQLQGNQPLTINLPPPVYAPATAETPGLPTSTNFGTGFSNEMVTDNNPSFVITPKEEVSNPFANP